jgi:hypothetical protein
VAAMLKERHNKIIILCLKNIFASLIISFLWACTAMPPQHLDVSQTFSPKPTNTATFTQIPQTITPTIIPSPTLTPTLTSTPVPTLTSHQWHAAEELISFGTFGGDMSCGTYNPDLLLLSDGEVFFLKKIDQSTQSWQTTKLSRQATCKLLNSIDQAGFFDYDPLTYITDPQIMGDNTTTISIKAWRSKSIGLYHLNVSFYFYGSGCKDCQDPGFFTLLPALRKTYQLLSNYQPENSEVYRPDRLGVWLNPGYGENKAVPWPVKSINLSKIVSQTGIARKPDFILTGQDAETVYQLYLQNSGLCSASFSQGGIDYEMAVRYLLPDEYPSKTPVPITLSCSPADGWVEVP